MRLLLGTTNKGKIAQLQELLAGLPNLTIVTPHDVPALPEVVEDGETFAANAEKKARAYAEATGLCALADDSGLCVDALGGAPGVYSARYAGSHATDAENNDKLLRALREVPMAQRGAHYRASLCLVDLAGEPLFAEGTSDGRILTAPRGKGGFGYDPLFLPEGLERTVAELSHDEWLPRSHRGRALARLLELLWQRAGGS